MMDNLWGEVMRKCLQRAETLLDKKTAPTAETARAVRELVETAIAIEEFGKGLPIGHGAQCVTTFKDGKVQVEKR